MTEAFGSDGRLLRVGVIGAGQMGRNHVRVLADMGEVEFVGVADPDPHVRARIAHTFRLPTYATVDELLRGGDPEALVVAVPTSQHLAMTLPLLQSGRHVLLEKPIADTVENGVRLVEAARAAGVVLLVGHVERFNPAVLELKRHLDEGVAGRLYEMKARRIGPFPPRIKDVGATIDLATHDLNVMEFVAGGPIKRLYAETARHLHSSREDMVTATMRFENGIIGSLDVNWLTPTKIRELYVGGERGMFHVNYLTQDLTYFENSSAPGSADTLLGLGVAEGRAIRYPIQRVEPLRSEIAHFAACIREGHAPLVSGEEAVRALFLAQQAVASAREHRQVSCERAAEALAEHA